MSEEVDPTEPTEHLSRKRAEAAAAWFDPALEEDPDDSSAFSDVEDSLNYKPGDRIGRYQLIKQLGEGGFGIVWQAEQSEPIKKEVALKIIRPGMDSRVVVARFRAEQKALERMEHPNIAGVLDAGTTETRLPYFVMELVRGPSITEYAEQHKLGVRERIRLMIDVCRGVQHAHHKGIMHRDLKPSNILVETKDGKPIPKVIDFGIAKALIDDLDGLGSFAYTAHGMVLGTPQYMAPEQAMIGAEDMDIRVDVYSLGAILFEMLTGSPPMVLNRASRTSVDKLLQRIHEDESGPPSDRAKQRLAEKKAVPVPASLLKRELDWITLRALEKRPDRRYSSVNELSEEMQRYLNNEPVETGPPDNIYRLQKLIKRHQSAFVAAGAIGLMLLVSTIVSVRAFVHEASARERAEQHRKEAEASKKTAEAESNKANTVAKFLSELLVHAGTEIDNGKNPEALRLALDKSVKEIDGLQGQPVMQAQLCERLADVYLAMGDQQHSLLLRYRQLESLKAAYGDDDPRTLRMQLDIAYGESDQGDKAKGLAICDYLVNQWEAIGAKGSGDWFDAASFRAVQLGRLDRSKEAEKQMLSIMGYRNSRGVLASDDGAFLRRLAELQTYNKEYDAAKATLDRCLALASSRSKKTQLAQRQSALTALAHVEAVQGKHAEAAHYLEESIKLMVQLRGEQYHPLIEAWIELSRHYVEEKQFDQAIKATQAALSIARVTGNIEKLPHAVRAAAEIFQAANRPLEALPLRKECVDAQRRIKPTTNLWLDDRLELLKLLTALEQLDESERTARLFWQEIQESSTALPDDSFMKLACTALIESCEKWQSARHQNTHAEDIRLWKAKLADLKEAEAARKFGPRT